MKEFKTAPAEFPKTSQDFDEKFSACPEDSLTLSWPD